MFFNKLFGKYKLITMTVILAVLVACLIFVIFRFYVSDVDNAAEQESAVTQTMQVSADSSLSGDSCFLVVCNDDGASDIIFMFLADFRVYSSSLILTPLNPQTVSADGRTYDEAYTYGGINMIKANIESVRNISVDRYAVLDRDGMSSLTDLMGEVELNAQFDFTYFSSDKSYEVKSGEVEMGADMLFSYLEAYSQKFGSDSIADLVCDIINFYLDSIDNDDTAKLFANVTNCFDTDVTISDYYSAKDDIDYMLEHDITCVLADDVNS